MKTTIVCLLLGCVLHFHLAAAPDLSPEKKLSLRLHAILGTNSVVRDTAFGGRMILVETTSTNFDLHVEAYYAFRRLSSIGTLEAALVLAPYLDDDRYTSEPGSDYGAIAISYNAADSLAEIAAAHPGLIPGAPTPPPASDRTSWRYSRIAAWKAWWATNRVNCASQQPPKAK